MKKWRTNLPKWLREKRDWDEWQSRLCFATILPRLLAPNRRRRRSQITTLHYLVLLERLAGEKGRSASAVRELVIKRLKGRLMDLVHTARIGWYREQLLLTAKASTYLSSILMTGLIVKALESRHGVRNDWRVLDQHRGGRGFIIRDEEELEEVWRKWKHAAHLCAAFVDYLPRQPALQIDDKTWRMLEDNMANFVTTALHYQRFLTGERIMDGVSIPSATIRLFEIAKFEKLNLSARSFAKSDLPVWVVGQ